MSHDKTCPDCGVKPGELHKSGCDVERCPRCGHQKMLSCHCIYDIHGMDTHLLDEYWPEVYKKGPTKEMYEHWDNTWGKHRIPWSGVWPGVAECEEFGWYSKMIPGRGWVICDKDDPEADPDLNRLVAEAKWSIQQQRFVKKEST